MNKIRKALEQSTDKVKKNRLNICQSCEHFRPSTSQCRVCGCFMKVKARFKHVKCPTGKW